MAEYRTLRMSFWNDPYVEELGPEGRLLYLYLITCPHTNSLGVLEVSTRRMAYETGLSPESVDALIAEAERAGKLVKDGTLLRPRRRRGWCSRCGACGSVCRRRASAGRFGNGIRNCSGRARRMSGPGRVRIPCPTVRTP